MPQKIKFIIIGLGVLLIVSLFVNLQVMVSKQAVERDRDILQNEKTGLLTKIDSALKDSKRLEEKISLMSKDMDKVSRDLDKAVKDKSEVQKRYDNLNREKDSLVEQLQSRPNKVEEKEVRVEVVRPVPSTGTTEDTYWAGVLKAKADLELKLDNLRNELKMDKVTIEQLSREKSSVSLELKNLEMQNSDIKRQLEYNQQITDAMTQELVREKNDKLKIQDEIKVLKSDSISLRRQVENVSVRKSKLEEKVAQLEVKNSELEHSLNKAQGQQLAQADALKQQAGPDKRSPEAAPDKKDSVELPTIVVRPQKETLSSAQNYGQKGKVSLVNRDNKFVIINLGEESGVRVGDMFKVYKADKEIAVIEAIRVRRDITACDVKSESAPITIGDIVLR
jgi:chromosome segregation ATPase